MKFYLSIIFSIITLSILNAQDTTIVTKNGRIELKRIGLSNNYHVKGNYLWSFDNQEKKLLIEGKIKKVNYEYTYTRTFHGSTQPANPKEFYKPIKATGYYYFPISDITIWYNDSAQIKQIFKIDSNILRTYSKEGKLESIHFYNSSLELDSIYTFYTNGKIKNKKIGNWNPKKENLNLHLYRDAVILSDRNKIEPKVEIEHHGNGKPYIHLSFNPDEGKRKSFEQPENFNKMNNWYSPPKPYHYNYHGYTNTYQIFDTAGIPTNDSYYTSKHKWTGVTYEYYDNGILKSKKILYMDQPKGLQEFWDEKGELTERKYHRGYSIDSTVYYKKIEDTLFTWKAPSYFQWNTNTLKIDYVRNSNVFYFHFNDQGEIIDYSFEGNRFQMNTKNPHYKPVDEHLGEKDKYGLPHGKWVARNNQKDTVYEIHFYHGRLHGSYHVEFEKQNMNWTRNFNMGIECDSSFQIYNGVKNKIYYYSSPGVIGKAIEKYADGKINRIDTVLNGVKFFRILLLDNEGWVREKSTFNDSTQRIYTRNYMAENTLYTETWYDYGFQEVEVKRYYPNSTQLKTHTIYTGLTSVPANYLKDVYDEKGEFIESIMQMRTVKLSTRKSYNEQGELIEDVKLQDGMIIKE